LRFLLWEEGGRGKKRPGLRSGHGTSTIRPEITQAARRRGDNKKNAGEPCGEERRSNIDGREKGRGKAQGYSLIPPVARSSPQGKGKEAQGEARGEKGLRKHKGIGGKRPARRGRQANIEDEMPMARGSHVREKASAKKSRR